MQVNNSFKMCVYHLEEEGTGAAWWPVYQVYTEQRL